MTHRAISAVAELLEFRSATLY